jgi:hypothetical protein
MAWISVFELNENENENPMWLAWQKYHISKQSAFTMVACERLEGQPAL